MAVNGVYQEPAIKEEVQQGVTTLWGYHPTQALRTELLPQSYHLVRGPGEGTFSLVGNIQYAAAAGFQPSSGSSEAPTLCYPQSYVQQAAGGSQSLIQAPALSFPGIAKSHSNEPPAGQRTEVKQEAPGDESHSQQKTGGRQPGPAGEEKRYQCDTCFKAFSQSKYLIKHAKTHAGRKFSCPQCNKLLSSSDALRTHTQVHTGLKPYPCVVCGKSYGRKEHLRRHTLIHTKGERLKCPECHKSFYDERTLQEHSWRHTGYRPYNCAPCNRSFSTQANLEAHSVSLKHKNMAERKYKAAGGGGLSQPTM